MSTEQLQLNEEPKPDAPDCQILVKDVTRYLSGLARINESGMIGNPVLSEGLRHVVRALRPYSNCPVHELAITLKGASSASFRKPSVQKTKASLPPDLESLRLEDIEEILNDDGYTKAQLAELGFRRLGISSSSLERLRKADALSSIRAAIEHEKSLDVISRQAQKSGAIRAPSPANQLSGR